MSAPAATAGEAFAPAAPDALAGRVILITGAYGGLGEAAAKACTQAGATVVLLDAIGLAVVRRRAEGTVRVLGPTQEVGHRSTLTSVARVGEQDRAWRSAFSGGRALVCG